MRLVDIWKKRWEEMFDILNEDVSSERTQKYQTQMGVIEGLWNNMSEKDKEEIKTLTYVK